MDSKDLNKFISAKQIFQKDLYDNDGDPSVCRLHKIFDSLNDDSLRHNCLGCNLAGMIILINNFFSRIESYDSLEDISFDFILKLYLAAERIQTICNLLNISEKEQSQNFPNLKRIKRWANFIKHPKAFMLTHHSNFSLSNDSAENVEDTVCINSDFIERYYGGGKHNKELTEKIANKETVCVIFPEPEQLVESFATDIKKFMSMVEGSPNYIEELSNQTTIHDYFDNLESD